MRRDGPDDEGRRREGRDGDQRREEGRREGEAKHAARGGRARRDVTAAEVDLNDLDVAPHGGTVRAPISARDDGGARHRQDESRGQPATSHPWW